MPTVRLLDGTEVDSASEAWRMECEARHVCRIATLHERRAYLMTARRKRGTVAGDALDAAVRAVWAAEFAKPKPAPPRRDDWPDDLF